MRRSVLALAAVLAVVTLCAAPAGATERIQPLKASARPAAGAGSLFFRDRVIRRTPRAGAAAFTGGDTRSYLTIDGLPVEVTTSRSVSGNAQSYVDFLSSRVHGDELTLLRVFIGTQSEVNSACGGGSGVLACYSRGERRMYVPDRDPANGGPFTRDYAVTHEYGHHIASYRSNFPFPALNWGAKRWASYEHVCARVSSRQLYPGNQGEHYLEDPGEGFADTYAHLHYPAVVWQFSPLMRPDAGAFEALRRDVVDPWRIPVRRTSTGALSAGRRAAQMPVVATLDGQLAARLQSPRGAKFDLELRNHGRLLQRVGGSASSKRANVLICRGLSSAIGSATVRAVRRSGSGPFTLTVDYPG
jgi:hypothetical protein